VVSNLIVQALKGEEITVYGDGSQTRSFCYVDDLIDGFLALMDTPPDVTGPVNLGNPGEFSIAELAEIVLELTGSRSKVVYKSLPADDPRQRRPDIALAKGELGWEPKIQLREGLMRTIAYFEDLLREEGTLKPVPPKRTPSLKAVSNGNGSGAKPARPTALTGGPAAL
jgi:UDP-glucuronate decarboxylase